MTNSGTKVALLVWKTRQRTWQYSQINRSITPAATPTVRGHSVVTFCKSHRLQAFFGNISANKTKLNFQDFSLAITAIHHFKSLPAFFRAFLSHSPEWQKIRVWSLSFHPAVPITSVLDCCFDSITSEPSSSVIKIRKQQKQCVSFE